jgi:Fur family transcriptional regulator, ferric uptake regulator
MSSPYTPDSLKAELNAKGWRLTPQREVILKLFQSLPRGNHLSAEDLHEILAERGEQASISTVYRTVKLMARMGILRELELSEGQKCYEINTTSPHHHHHLVCVQCGRTVEFENDSVLKQGLKQAQKEGMQVIDCQLTIYTICPAAVRIGWPAGVPSEWACLRAIAE